MYFTYKLLRLFLKPILLPFRLVRSLLSIGFGAVSGTSRGAGTGNTASEWSPQYFSWTLYALAAFQLHGAYIAIADDTIYWFDQVRAILYSVPIVDLTYVVLLFPDDSEGMMWMFGFGSLGYAAAYGYVGRRVSHDRRLSDSLRSKCQTFFAANAVGAAILPAVYARAVMSEYEAMHLTYGEFYDGLALSLLGYTVLMGGLYAYADRIATTTVVRNRSTSTSTSSATSPDDADTAPVTDDASPGSTVDGGDGPSGRPDSNGATSGTGDAGAPSDTAADPTPAVAPTAGGDSADADGTTAETVTESATAGREADSDEPSLETIFDGLAADAAAERESAIAHLRTRASTDAASLSGEIDRLRAVLDATEDRAVKIAIVDALGAIDDQAATDVLEQARLDPDREVSDAACRALRDE